MWVAKYYVVELTEDVDNSWNSRIYNKGVRTMVWEDNRIGCFWTVNTNDNFKFNCAKKLYEFEGKEIV